MTPVAKALLKLSLVSGVGPAYLRKTIKAAHAKDVELPWLVENRALHDVLSVEQLHELTVVGNAFEETLAKLDAFGVDVVCCEDATYPAQLLRTWGVARVPPLLMIRGNRELLNRDAVGFTGSREAGERGLRAARDCADQLAAAGVVIASGYAAGVDTCAHTAALKAGGTTIVVLAEGIQNFRVKAEIESAWSWERVCVVSEFAASAPWSVGTAMQRNRTIVGVSRAVILVEARATGGSIATGRYALDANVPLFAVEYEGMPESAIGNRQLIQQGAVPLRRSRQTTRANLDRVFETIRERVVANDAAPMTAERQTLLW